jgi:hypothetical protein
LTAEAESHQAALDAKHATLLWLRAVLPPDGQHLRINFALPPPTPPGARLSAAAGMGRRARATARRRGRALATVAIKERPPRGGLRLVNRGSGQAEAAIGPLLRRQPA